MTDTIAMYIRISLEDTDLQNGKAESNSITNQRELIRAFIQNRNEFLGCRVKEFFDDGFTGRNFDRPGFQDMIAECRTGRIRCVIVKDDCVINARTPKPLENRHFLRNSAKFRTTHRPQRAAYHIGTS